MKAEQLKAEINRLGLNISDLSVDLSEKVTVTGTTLTNAEPEAQFYTVESGDLLSKISKSFYGYPMKCN